MSRNTSSRTRGRRRKDASAWYGASSSTTGMTTASMSSSTSISARYALAMMTMSTVGSLDCRSATSRQMVRETPVMPSSIMPRLCWSIGCSRHTATTQSQKVATVGGKASCCGPRLLGESAFDGFLLPAVGALVPAAASASSTSRTHGKCTETAVSSENICTVAQHSNTSRPICAVSTSKSNFSATCACDRRRCCSVTLDCAMDPRDGALPLRSPAPGPSVPARLPCVAFVPSCTRVTVTVTRPTRRERCEYCRKTVQCDGAKLMMALMMRAAEAGRRNDGGTLVSTPTEAFAKWYRAAAPSMRSPLVHSHCVAMRREVLLSVSQPIKRTLSRILDTSRWIDVCSRRKSTASCSSSAGMSSGTPPL
mmetsp:Transcript_4802/g.15197  ORF Transcript_4802/g.15197 Transcript_4802/m.15197 type:complete len:366 (-) Transcript_4802:2205-3302(-)